MADPETNVYDFGLLLLEIISGKLPHSEEKGALVDLVNKISSSKFIGSVTKVFFKLNVRDFMDPAGG